MVLIAGVTVLIASGFRIASGFDRGSDGYGAVLIGIYFAFLSLYVAILIATARF